MFAEEGVGNTVALLPIVREHLWLFDMLGFVGRELLVHELLLDWVAHLRWPADYLAGVVDLVVVLVVLVGLETGRVLPATRLAFLVLAFHSLLVSLLLL